MTARLTPLALSGLTLVAVALFLGVVSARAELFLAGAPVLAMLLWSAARAGGRSPDIDLRCEPSADRLLEGERLSVTLIVTAGSKLSALELLAPFPPLTELVAGTNHTVQSLHPGRPAQWRYALQCPTRGRFGIGTVHLRAWDRAGFVLSEGRAVDAHAVSVYPHTVPLRRLPAPRRTQTSAGNYVAAALGEGLEPGGVREFAPGDRVRRIHWRSSLRLGKLYVTEYQQERNADIVVMLDTLSEVGTPPATSLDVSIRAAASLASAYLARKDRVGLIEYGGVFRWVRPGMGRAHYERLLDLLAGTQTMFSYVAKDLALVPPRILPPQALVLAISPLLDDRFIAAAGNLSARGFDLVLIAMSPTDFVEAASPREDLARRLWALEWQAKVAGLRRQGLMIQEWRPEEPLEATLAPLALQRRRTAVGT